MQRVWYARNGIEAAQVVDALREAGFDARSLGEGLAMAAGGLPTSVTGPEIFIGEHDSRSEALRVIEEWSRQGGDRPLFPADCVQCGYDLRGCVDPRCPECGYVYRAVPSPWNCAGCGESVEGHFSACWRCGRAAPESAAGERAGGTTGEQGAGEPGAGEQVVGDSGPAQGAIAQSARSVRRHERLPVGAPWSRGRLLVIAGVLLVAGAICARASEAESASCYVGPLEVRVFDSAGRPAAGVEVGWLGMTWDDAHGELRRRRSERADGEGVYRLTSIRECMFPTMVYACDPAQRTAAIAILRSKAELAQAIRMQLVPATRAQFDFSRGADWIGPAPALRFVYVFPTALGPFSGRGLLAVMKDRDKADFLLPPMEYSIVAGADRAATIRSAGLRVSAGQEAGAQALELQPSPLVRLAGRDAPEWRVAAWLDGGTRTLASFRGRPVLLVFETFSDARRHVMEDVAGMLQRVGPENLQVVVVFEGSAESFEQCEESVWRCVAVGATMPWGPRIADWPVLVARDAAPQARSGDDPPSSGPTWDAYASEHGVSLVLIDAEGCVRANDVHDRAAFEGLVAHEAAAARRGETTP